MVVKNEGQALCVAVEMEKRAIRVYERALMLATDPAVIAGIREILADEREHLRCFSEMKAQYPVTAEEEKLLISSMAAEPLRAVETISRGRSPRSASWMRCSFPSAARIPWTRRARRRSLPLQSPNA